MSKTLFDDAMNLDGRIARCTACGAERPSTTELALFEYTGLGSYEAENSCIRCTFFRMAHEAEHMDKLSNGERRPTVVEDGRCPGFENDPKGRPYDRYQCGCRRPPL
jgi:hypothetical protein